jgi:hypothetical protein
VPSEGPISYDDLADMIGGQLGVFDVPCPECGPKCRHAYNRKRPVLRVWGEDDGFISYHCERCKVGGWAKVDAGAAAKPRAYKNAPKRIDTDTADREQLANMLWDRAKPIAGSPAETYLRSRKCFVDSPSLRFLPAKGEHAPSMIARFGTGKITGVHLTKLRDDGQGKAGTDKDKIMLGPSQGQFIMVHDNAESEALIITEGIEDAASFAAVMGWSAWAAGSAGRIANIVGQAGRFNRLLLAVDNDLRGLGVHYENAWLKVFEAALAIRPDLISINISRQFKGAIFDKTDANAVLRTFGADTLANVVERALLQDDFRRRRISLGAYQRALANIKLPDQDQLVGR